MKRVVAVIAVVLFAFVVFPVASMAADPYPAKPVTRKVTMAAGGFRKCPIIRRKT